ncbi:MAG TPA: dicarboxylate/amino acid:cation symporter, partial [Bacteroidia bacterium]|nr:dicarboxylate/amino acid:cation symporter [Bacteroidia bacterium]
MFSKKNRLITSIVIAMIIGLITGFLINRSIVAEKTDYAKITLVKSGDVEVIKKVEAGLNKFSEKTFKEQKKKIASRFSILSDIFLRMVKMIIAPLVFAVLVLGVAKVGDFKSVGRIGLKTLIYFTSATLIALMLGLVIVNIFQPGKVMHLDKPDSSSETGIKSNAQDAKNFISHVIPDSIVNAMASNDVLPIVVFALFFGVAAASLGKQGEAMIKACDSLAHIMFKITNYVMNFAPVGIFGAITAVVIMQGLDVLNGYAYLIMCFFGGLLFFVFVVLWIIAVSFKIKFYKLLSDVKEPILLAFSTASSESAMPKTIEALEKHGISNRIVSFVLPLGYSFNLDGSIMYMTFATLFIAQSYGMDIGMTDQIK